MKKGYYNSISSLHCAYFPSGWKIKRSVSSVHALQPLKSHRRFISFCSEKTTRLRANKDAIQTDQFNHLFFHRIIFYHRSIILFYTDSSNKWKKTCFRNLTVSAFQVESAMGPYCRIFKFVLMCVPSVLAHLNNYVNDKQQSKMFHQYSCILSSYVLQHSSLSLSKRFYVYF